jgi:HSP20 family protein
VARVFVDRREGGEELRRLARWLDEEPPAGATGECSPPLDVVETAASVELLMDLPGIQADRIRVILSGGTILIAGQKTPKACAHRDATFQLAERCFGRFARAVRLTGAFDAGRAAASLVSGELRIVLPRIEERRGRDIRIPVAAAE